MLIIILKCNIICICVNLIKSMYMKYIHLCSKSTLENMLELIGVFLVFLEKK